MKLNSKTPVLYLNWMGEMGGAEIALTRLLRHLDLQSFEPHVFQIQKSRQFADQIHALNIPLKVFSISRFRDLLWRWDCHIKLFQYLRRHQIKVLHANGTLAYLAGYLAAKCAGVPIIWWLVDMPEGKALPEKMAGASTPQAVLCNSQATRKALTQFYPKLSPLTSVIYPAIEVPLQSLSADEKKKFCEELNIQPDNQIISSLGRLQRWKGQDNLIKAIPQVLKPFPHAVFLLIGEALPGMEDGFKRELESLIASLGIQKQCRMLGFQKDISSLIQISDLIVHTSVKPEPFGLVVAEAMSWGKPVIATQQGGILEQITHQMDGWLTPPANPEALAQAIISLLGNEKTRLEMGETARRKAQVFLPSQIARQTETLYRNLIIHHA